MRSTAASAAAGVVLLTAGCSLFDGARNEGTRENGPPAAQVVTSDAGQPLTLVPDEDPVSSAVGASRAFFDAAEVVVLAPDGDEESRLVGASAAVALGVPMLVVPQGGEQDAEVVTDELDRLGAGTVLAVGDAPLPDGDRRDVVVVPADPDAVASAAGLDFADAEPVAAGSEAAAVAALDREAPAALRPVGAGASAPQEQPDAGSVPEVTPGTARSDTVVLTTGGVQVLAGIATARAAGARVLVTGGPDPRASAEVVSALSEDPSGTVVALGAAVAAQDGLDWKIATAATGAQLPGGGQLLLPGRMLVALYGQPGTGALGVLGEQGIEASVQRARDTAAPYEALVDVPVVPAFEIIATVASSSAGDDGDYSAEADVEVLRPWVEAAGRAGIYVVLDLQPGRTDFVAQAERYRSLLELPHVGLALDPEWRLGPGEVHLRQIGSVQIDEVNRVVTWLADLTRANALPQKLLVLHQFRLSMIEGRERLDMSREELAVMVHVDGQGAQGDKQATWRALRQGAPAELFWGWKNFYDEDAPMLTPEQTVAQVDPVPALVSYQ